MCRHIRLRTASIALATLLIAVLASGSAEAQNYGQNPGTPGFVPLANGPIPSGTTGGINNTADADGSVAEDGSPFGFDSNTNFSFEPGRLTLTATNVSDSHFLGFLASLGTVDFTFESMSGMDIRLQSTFDGTTLTVTLDFNGGPFGGDDDTDTNTGTNTNGGTTSNGPNDVPDANPADDNMNTDDNTSDFDSSPGNPFVR